MSSVTDEIVLCMLMFVVAVQAFARFHSPPSNRSTTTAIRYYSAAAFYCAVYVLGFFLLTRYPAVYEALVAAFGLERTAAATDALRAGSTQSATIALVVNTVIPNTPIIRDLDAAFRRHLSLRALIGYEALVLGQRLIDSGFEVPGGHYSEAVSRLSDHGIAAKDLTASADDPARNVWIRVVSLMITLENLDHDEAFSAFSAEGRVDLAKIKSRYERVSENAATLFTVLRPALAAHAEALGTLAASFESSFAKEASGLYGSMCYLLGRVALSRGLTERKRVELLRASGFVVSHAKSSNLDGATLMLLLMFVVAITTNIAAGIDQTVLAAAQRGLVVVSSAMVTIACAWLVRVRFGRPHEPGDMRPIFSYAVASVAAVALFLPIRTLLRAWMENETLEAAISRQAVESPLLLITLIATFGLAWCLDDRGGAKLSGIWLSAVESLSLGLVLLAAAMLVGDFRPPSPTYFRDNSALFVVSFVHGAMMGAMVPAWRRSPRREVRREIVKRFRLGEAAFV